MGFMPLKHVAIECLESQNGRLAVSAAAVVRVLVFVYEAHNSAFILPGLYL